MHTIHIYNNNRAYVVCHGNANDSSYCAFHFSVDGNNVIIDDANGETITKIVGIN